MTLEELEKLGYLEEDDDEMSSEAIADWEEKMRNSITPFEKNNN